MHHHNDVNEQLSLKLSAHSPLNRRRSILCLAGAFGWAFITLACTLITPHSSLPQNGIVMLTRLPTFTRTPLPPLVLVTPAPSPLNQPAATIDAALPPPLETTDPAVAPPVPPPPPMTIQAPATAVAVVTTGSAATPAPTTAPVTAAVETAPTPTPTSPPSLDPASPTPNAAIPANPEPTATAQPDSPTATPAPTGTATPLPTATPTDTATATPVPTATPIPTETPTPLPEGWVFSGVHGHPAEALAGMVFYGNLMNNTGSPQQLNEINTTLYDAQGQQIAFEKAIDQWPVRAVPPGGQVPFGVVIPDVQGVADFNFEVESEPGGDIPREDFEFVDIQPSTEDEQYCLTGRLRNLGDQLQAYLMVTAVLYDDQDQVINYNNAFKSAPTQIVGDETLDVDLCIKSLQQEVARYELRAWGL